MPALTFRTATPSDAMAVVALVESAYRGEASRAGWTTEADLLGGQRTDTEDVLARIADPRQRIVLAFEGGTLGGSVLLRDEGGGSAYTGMLAVRPTLQGRGTGRALLAEAERIAVSDMGATTMRMTVIAQRTELLAWYERRSYQLTGEREPFPYGDERFGKPARDDLYFVVLKKTL